MKTDWNSIKNEIIKSLKNDYEENQLLDINGSYPVDELNRALMIQIHLKNLLIHNLQEDIDRIIPIAKKYLNIAKEKKQKKVIMGFPIIKNIKYIITLLEYELEWYETENENEDILIDLFSKVQNEYNNKLNSGKEKDVNKLLPILGTFAIKCGEFQIAYDAIKMFNNKQKKKHDDVNRNEYLLIEMALGYLSGKDDSITKNEVLETYRKFYELLWDEKTNKNTSAINIASASYLYYKYLSENKTVDPNIIYQSTINGLIDKPL